MIIFFGILIACWLLFIVIPRCLEGLLNDLLGKPTDSKAEGQPIKIIYQNPQSQKKFIYRPQTLEQYIGQEKAKNLVRLNVKKIHTLRPVHFLVNGKKGCGKSTLCYLINNELNATMIERVSSAISTKEDVYNLVNEINAVKEGYVILFIDEIHNLARVPEIAELFYPVMEDFKIEGKPIRPFSILGATTEKNMLVTKLSPFVDRFQAQIELENYTEEELVTILKQYKEQLYNDKNVPEKIYGTIAKNCKFTPRIAITLLEDYLVEQNIERILEYHRIVKEGLTDIDFKILETLNENDKPIGEKALSQMVGVNMKDFREVYEPYLIEKGFVIRTPRGRTISKKGKEIL